MAKKEVQEGIEETQAATAVAEPVVAQTEETVPAKKKGRRSKADLTLADLAVGYAKHMEEVGKSNGTVSSYAMELKTAMAELGEETRVADLTPELVQTFFDCDRVTKLRSGKPKAQASIAKTRRVLRLALWWAVDAGLIKKAPVPEPAAS